MPEWLYWTILVLVTLPIDFLTAWAVFDDLDGFLESLMYAIKPDILSWIQGQGVDDAWGELKLYIWLGLCVGLVFVANFITQNYIVS